VIIRGENTAKGQLRDKIIEAFSTHAKYQGDPFKDNCAVVDREEFSNDINEKFPDYHKVIMEEHDYAVYKLKSLCLVYISFSKNNLIS